MNLQYACNKAKPVTNKIENSNFSNYIATIAYTFKMPAVKLRLHLIREKNV